MGGEVVNRKPLKQTGFTVHVDDRGNTSHGIEAGTDKQLFSS